MQRLIVDPANPDPALVWRTAEVLRGGGLAVVPTDTLYGLAANPFDSVAVGRVFTVKRRDADQGLPLIAADRAQVERMLGPLPPDAARLAERYWPGPLTLLVPRTATLEPDVTGGRAQVAVRVPDHSVARAVCEACGTLLTATSANISGQPPSNDPDVVARTLPEGIDLLLDAGLTPGGPPSTIVDLAGPQPVLVRPGAIPWEEVLACLASR